MMEELKNILITHAKRYPLMQPADAVKLIYQNEFGGGHLIRDEQACLNYLRREYDSVEKDPRMPLCEEIGNGISRVNLAALEEAELDRLGQTFIRSAALHKGDMDSFLSKLAILAELVGEHVFAFDSAEFLAYLTEYEKAGYPAVSHSAAYRAAYQPAYRIVKTDLYR